MLFTNQASDFNTSQIIERLKVIKFNQKMKYSKNITAANQNFLKITYGMLGRMPTWLELLY